MIDSLIIADAAKAANSVDPKKVAEQARKGAGFKTVIGEIKGKTVLLVEQNAQAALAVADEGYIMENGRIVLDGPADKLLRNEDVREFYLGFAEGGTRKSMREVKHYKRRKRWLS